MLFVLFLNSSPVITEGYRVCTELPNRAHINNVNDLFFLTFQFKFRIALHNFNVQQTKIMYCF